MQLDFRDARPIYSQIIDSIREQIVSGVLRQGDRLPSVRELACRLTINPNTIQRAYRELEMQGWIASVPGKGSFICGIPSEQQRRRLELLAQYDKLVRNLLALGLSRDDLIAHIQQGGASAHA